MGAFSLIVVINLLNSFMSGDDVFCVGLWVSAAKLEKLRFDKLRDYMKPHNIELLVLNDKENKLHESLETSRMDLILFKLTDSSLTEEQNRCNTHFARKVEREQKNLRFVDRLESVEKLLDRLQTSHITQTVCASMATLQNMKWEKLVRCKLPEEPIELFLSSNNLRFPLICKPKATGYRCLHSMVLLFDDKQLDEFCSSHKSHVHSSEFVVANFVNHGSCLLKVSVIGAHVFVSQRPSVRNFYPHTYPQSCIYFDTADVSKLSSKSDLIGPREHVDNPEHIPSPTVTVIIDVMCYSSSVRVILRVFGRFENAVKRFGKPESAVKCSGKSESAVKCSGNSHSFYLISLSQQLG